MESNTLNLAATVLDNLDYLENTIDELQVRSDRLRKDSQALFDSVAGDIERLVGTLRGDPQPEQEVEHVSASPSELARQEEAFAETGVICTTARVVGNLWNVADLKFVPPHIAATYLNLPLRQRQNERCFWVSYSGTGSHFLRVWDGGTAILDFNCFDEALSFCRNSGVLVNPPPDDPNKEDKEGLGLALTRDGRWILV